MHGKREPFLWIQEKVMEKSINTKKRSLWRKAQARGGGESHRSSIKLEG